MLRFSHVAIYFSQVARFSELIKAIFAQSGMSPWVIPLICLVLAAGEICFIAMLGLLTRAGDDGYAVSSQILVGYILAIVIGRAVLSVAANYFLSRFTMSGLAKFRMKKFELLYSDRIANFDRGFWLDVFGRRSNQLFQIYILQLAKAAVEITIVGTICIYLILRSEHVLMIYLIPFLVLLAIIFLYVARVSRGLGLEVAEASKDVMSLAATAFDSREEVKVNRLQNWVAQLQSDSVNRYSTYQSYYLAAQSVPKPFIESMIFMAVFGFIFLGTGTNAGLLEGAIPILFLGLRMSTLLSLLSRLALQFGFASPSLELVKM